MDDFLVGDFDVCGLIAGEVGRDGEILDTLVKIQRFLFPEN